MSSNPFHGIPLDDGGPKRRRNLYRYLAAVIGDMLDHPNSTRDQRQARLKGNNSDVSLCQHAMSRLGLVEWIRMRSPECPYGSVRQQCFLLGTAIRKFRRAGPDQILAWAIEEHDRQFGSVTAPSWGGPHRSVAPVVPKPGWPKDLPCPRCRQMHKATWEGDRYHAHCRRQAFEQASEIEPYAMGSLSGNRRAGRRA